MKKNDDFVITIVICVFASFFAGIAFVNNVLAIGSKNPEIDVYKVPFIASVWGTVSDWLLVLATVVTAAYLIKSFHKQKEFNKAQEDINSEQKEFNRVSIIPQIAISNIKPESNSTQTVTLIMRKNTAYNFGVFRIYHGFLVSRDNNMALTAQNWIEGTTITITNVAIQPPNPADMVFSFRDLSGRLYEQFLRLETNGGFMLSIPIQKSEDELG